MSKKNTKFRKSFSIANLLAILLFVTIFSIVFSSSGDVGDRLSYTSFKQLLTDNQVVEVTIEGGSPYIEGKKADGNKFRADNPNTEESNNLIYNSGVKVSYVKSMSSKVSSLMNVFWMVMLFGIIASIVVGVHKGPGGIGKSLFEGGIDTEPKKTDIKFKDVAGNEESKESMNELVLYLKDPQRFGKYGVKAPRGAMLFGPPGTGKTLLAKAVAGEADANFLAVTGSDFVDKFVGNGASRVRHLFEEARKNQPCIIFIDEIDAVGGKRGSHGGNEERHQTLNALLAEMDGFNEGDGIIVLGATNRLESLDEALLRSGRFDTKIYIGLPDISARKSIFNVHSKSKPLSEDVDFNELAKMTTMFSGADIENVLNKAGFLAAKEESEFITMKHIVRSLGALVAGDEKVDRSGISYKDKELTAYHEAGHAIIAKMVAKNNVSKVTIIPTTHGAGGYTIIDPSEKSYLTKADILNQVMYTLGGRAAESVIYGQDNVSTGASGDVRQATNLVRKMICDYGMCDEFGFVSLEGASGLDKEIYSEARSIIDELYVDTVEFLFENKELLCEVAEKLIEVETLNREEFEALLDI